MNHPRSQMAPPEYEDGVAGAYEPPAGAFVNTEPGAHSGDNASILTYDGSDSSTIRPTRAQRGPSSLQGGPSTTNVGDSGFDHHPDAAQHPQGGPTYHNPDVVQHPQGVHAQYHRHPGYGSPAPGQQAYRVPAGYGTAAQGNPAIRPYVHPAYAAPINFARSSATPHPYYAFSENPYQHIMEASFDAMRAYGSMESMRGVEGDDTGTSNEEGMRRTMFPSFFSSSGSSSSSGKKKKGDTGSSSRSAGPSGCATPAPPHMRPQFAADPHDPNFIPVVIPRPIFEHYFSANFWLWILGPHFVGSEYQLRNAVWALIRVLSESIGVPVPTPGSAL